MQTRNRIADGHRVAAIRRTFPVPDEVAAARPACATGRPAPVVPLFRPAAAVVDDGAARVGIVAGLDAQNRIAATKVIKPLGWTGDTALVARCSGGRVTVTAGTRTTPTQLPMPLDSAGRLTLPPAVLATVSATPGIQVVAVALPATGELILSSAAPWLAMVTGPVDVASGDDAPTSAQEHITPATRIRAGFRAEPPADPVSTVASRRSPTGDCASEGTPSP